MGRSSHPDLHLSLGGLAQSYPPATPSAQHLQRKHPRSPATAWEHEAHAELNTEASVFKSRLAHARPIALVHPTLACSSAHHQPAAGSHPPCEPTAHTNTSIDASCVSTAHVTPCSTGSRSHPAEERSAKRMREEDQHPVDEEDSRFGRGTSRSSPSSSPPSDVSPSSRRSSVSSPSASIRYDPSGDCSPLDRRASRGLRRTAGGFYEGNLAHASTKSLCDLLHDADDQPSNAPAPSMHTVEAQPLKVPELLHSASPNVEQKQESATPIVAASKPIVPASKPLPVSAHQAESLRRQQEEQDRSNLLGLIACTLEQLCPLPATLPSDPHFLSLFHTSALPGISIRDYLLRLASYTRVSDECLIQVAIHISRLARNGAAEVAAQERAATRPAADAPCCSSSPSPSPSPSPSVSSSSSTSSTSSSRSLVTHPRTNSFSVQPFLVSIYNIHRLLLTAMLTTAKLTDDFFYNNHVYANLGGISLRELNRLECEFLQLVDYRMLIDVDEFMSEYAAMNDPRQHGAWCAQAHHLLGPTMAVHPEEEPVDLEEAVVAMTIAPTTTTETTTPIQTPHTRTILEQIHSMHLAPHAPSSSSTRRSHLARQESSHHETKMDESIDTVVEQ